MSKQADEELEQAIREAIKAPLRSEISTSDFVVMGISSTKLAEIVFDIKKAVKSRDQQIALEAQIEENQKALNHGGAYINRNIFVDRAKQLAALKQVQNKEK